MGGILDFVLFFLFFLGQALASLVFRLPTLDLRKEQLSGIRPVGTPISTNFSIESTRGSVTGGIF
jgi:hypothetical protein